MTDLPSGPTRADARLEQDILHQIGKAWYYQRVHLAEVKGVQLMPDGQEIWMLEDPSNTIGSGYLVTLKGGGKFSAFGGLQAFQKGG